MLPHGKRLRFLHSRLDQPSQGMLQMAAEARYPSAMGMSGEPYLGSDFLNLLRCTVHECNSEKTGHFKALPYRSRS